MLERENNANTMASLFTSDKNLQKIRQAQFWLNIKKNKIIPSIDFH